MQTWLRPNVRILWLQIAAVLIVLLAALAITLRGVSTQRPVAAAAGAVLSAWSVWQLARRTGQLRTPRLAYHDGCVLVGTSANRHDRLPLAAVECFFLGAGEPDLPSRPPASRNLVIRLAERAEPWHQRPIEPRLGRWCGGYITLYGLWCEPIDVDRVRQLNHVLASAKRARKG